MAITAALVKELRERTGAGMMECKKALVESDGDLEAAAEHLRKTGVAKADKKSGRVAAEGRVVIEQSNDGKEAVLAELNCETDFVAKEDDFRDFAMQVARRILQKGVTDLDALMAMPYSDDDARSFEEVRKELVAKIGENIQVRRFSHFATQNRFGVYMHGTRIGVLVEYEGGDEELGKDLAMHIAASKPAYATDADVPEEVVKKEKEILVAQARDSGKPDDIIEKMTEGRLRKFLAEITLVGQPFVKDPDITVGKLLKDKGASVVRFERMEVGEGMEKKSENFADEVMAQVRGD